MSGDIDYFFSPGDVGLVLKWKAPEILPEEEYGLLEFHNLEEERIEELSDLEVIHAVIAARQWECRAQAIKLRLLGRLSRLRNRSRSVADELAPELRISRQAAQVEVAVAEALPRLPNLLKAMDAGELDVGKLRQASEATAPLSDGLARKVDEVAAKRIGEKNPGAWRKALGRIVRQVDPKGVRDRAEARRKDRKVELIHEPDSMASLWLYLPAEVASAVYARVDAIARSQKSDDRTMDQLRADVIADILLGKQGGIGGIAAQVFVHVPVDAALKIDDQGCELVGHGPIPAEVARGLMTDPNSVLRKVVTDPVTGHVRDVGRTRYRPPAAMSDVVRVRDRTCRMPGCSRPAQRCDSDHVQAWSEGGGTATGNLCCLCRHHHQLKDEPGWDFSYNGDTGELLVTTPAGRTHRSLPEPLVEPMEDDPPPF